MRGKLRQRLRRKEKPPSRQPRRRVALLRNRYVGGYQVSIYTGHLHKHCKNTQPAYEIIVPSHAGCIYLT